MSRPCVIAVKKMQMEDVLAALTVQEDAAPSSTTGTAALNGIVLLPLLTVLRLTEGKSCLRWQRERNNVIRIKMKYSCTIYSQLMVISANIS